MAWYCSRCQAELQLPPRHRSSTMWICIASSIQVMRQPCTCSVFLMYSEMELVSSSGHAMLAFLPNHSSTSTYAHLTVRRGFSTSTLQFLIMSTLGVMSLLP